MKAQIIESNSHVLGLRSEAKVHKSSKHHHSNSGSGSSNNNNKEEENEEIKAYLNKLQEIVPFMPKHKKLSKLEVITYVIDYIRDLRQTLGMPPTSARIPPIPSMDMDMDSDLTPVDSLTSTSNLLPHPTHHHSSSSRTPLSLISTPNNSSSSCASQSSQEIPQLMDKSPSSEVDTRPVSC